MGCVASVVNVSVNVQGLEREYIAGTGNRAVTFVVRGRVARVSKTTVLEADHGISRAHGADVSNEVPLASWRSYKASDALACQREMKLVGVKTSLYSLPARSEEVTKGGSSCFLTLNELKCMASLSKNTGKVPW